MSTSTLPISALDIHNQLHSKKVGDHIIVNNSPYSIRLRSSNKCKYVHVENVCFIEQNDKSNSKYGERAREGEKITWIVTGSKWGLICDDSVEESCSVLNEDGELTGSFTSFIKLNKKNIAAIHNALHDSSQKSITIQGKTFTKTCKKKCNLFEINGSQFIEQNKSKNSEFAKRAKKGEKITWVIATNVSGFNAHKSWGLVVKDGEIEKDCLLFQEDHDDDGSDEEEESHQHETIEEAIEETTIIEKEPVNETPILQSILIPELSNSPTRNENCITPIKKKQNSMFQHKRCLDKSSPSLFSSPASTEKSPSQLLVKCSPLEQVLEIPIRSRRTTRRKKIKSSPNNNQ